MKKEYIKPQMKAIKIRHARMLMTSGGIYNNSVTGTLDGADLDIKYGGIDDSGTLDPD